MNLDTRLISEARQTWFAVLLTILSGAVGGILIIFQAKFLSRVIANVHLSEWGLADARQTLLYFLLVVVGRFLFTWLSELQAGRIAVAIKTTLRQNILEKIERLGPVYLSGDRSGETTALLIQGLDVLDGYFSQFLPQICLAWLMPASVLVAVFPQDWLSGLIFIVTAPLIPIFMILIGGTAEKITQKQWGALSRMSGQFLEILQGLATLKALNQSQAAGSKVRSASEHYRNTTLQFLRVTFLSSLALELVSTISIALVAVQIGLRLLNGGIDFELALFILVVAPDFYLPLRQLGLRFHTAIAGISAARKIYELLDRDEPIRQVTIDPSWIWTQAPEIGFNDVSARYPGQQEDVLHQINLVLKAGSVTALVGRSGSGKTSLANLLLGFLQPSAGEIRIDNISLARINQHEWRKGLAWVGQNPAIFLGSLAENLRMGGEGWNEEDLWRVLEGCGLEKWVKTLPDGINTRVGDQGLRLSSGQRQRLALGRTMLRNPKLIILDEPTAHLDVTGEDDILESIKKICMGRTVLIIAHRLPTLQIVDQVIVMEAGKLAEIGPAEEIMRSSGRLRAMVQAYTGSRSL